jgi:PAS domain S-box-containing protein
MPRSKWKMQLAFGSAILTLLVTVWLSYRGYVLSLEGDRWSEHTHAVLEKIDDLLLAVKSNESTTRAFLLTGDGSYLDSHGPNILLAQQALASIGALTADNPKQQRQISVVNALLAARIQRWELVIDIRKSQGLAAAVAATQLGVGRRNTSGLQAAVDKMKDEELRLLALRDKGTKSRLRQSRNWTIFGTVLGLLITCAAGWSAQREISARGLAEGALLEREERFRDMANNISQLAWMADKSGSIYWYNQRWFDYTGTTLEEMAGWGWKKVQHPDYVQAVVEKISRCFLHGEVWEDTFPLRGRDGSYRWFLSRAVPIRDAHGAVSHWFGTNTDISELRESENHLAQMEARYRGLLEAAPDAMVVVNQSGEIVLLNVQAEKEFGYSRDELVGQKVTNIIPEGFAERLIADGTRTAAEALAQQIGTGIELKGRHKDGGEFPIEIMLSPLESTDGVLITAAVRDITKRKRAESQLVHKIEELNRSNAELEQFASLASHDLQEPLRMVGSYTQLLAKRYKGKLGSDADEYIGFAVDGANRMQRLIQDLLIYSRVGSGGGDLLNTSSEEALREAIKNLRGSVEASGALVTHDPLPMVQADQRQLTQLFQNLVGNAIKYQSPGTPRVHVSATREGKKWMFSVKDNGLGIEPQYFEKIFVMFQRLHKREEFNGTGIGLAICKKIVERHGGRISVESEPGHGSTFHFALAESKRLS